MREIPKEWIQGIGLLTVREASGLPRQLLRTGNWWFLEDGTEGPVNVASVCHDGSVSVPGIPPDVNYGRVRPVLRCSFPEEIPLFSSVSALGETWTVIPGETLLCEREIGKRTFNDTSIRPEDARYAGSGIEKTLGEWLSGKMEENQ